MDQYIGEIFMFGFNWAPKGFSLCNGNQLPVSQNQALFSLLGTTFGGNGSTNFALPDLRGRTSLGITNGAAPITYQQGSFGGAETVTLTQTQVPPHTHNIMASSAAANQNPPSNTNFLAKPGTWQNGGTQIDLYGPAAGTLASMATGAISTVGGQGHNNMQPSLVTNFCIALSGFFPMRN